MIEYFGLENNREVIYTFEMNIRMTIVFYVHVLGSTFYMLLFHSSGKRGTKKTQ